MLTYKIYLVLLTDSMQIDILQLNYNLEQLMFITNE